MPYYVYVIELNAEVLEIATFRERNPNMRQDGQCFYVGQSAHEPECRFRQHKECHGDAIQFECLCSAGPRVITKNLSNRFVRRYGQWIRWRMFEQYNPLETRADAERLEEKIATQLQDAGHAVWWN